MQRGRVFHELLLPAAKPGRSMDHSDKILRMKEDGKMLTGKLHSLKDLCSYIRHVSNVLVAAGPYGHCLLVTRYMLRPDTQ